VIVQALLVCSKQLGVTAYCNHSIQS